LKHIPEHGDRAVTKPTANGQALGSGVIALFLSVLAALAFVVNGYLEMHAGRGCDGGTCTVAFMLGLVQGAAALILGFPSLWLLIAGVRRAVRRQRR
jgi:hypothetical protein